MELSFKAQGNDKQLLAYEYWADKTTSEIAYGGAKFCHHPDTLVRTNVGMKKISEIKKGEKVLGINEKTLKSEFNKVLSIHRRGVGAGEYHKMITFVLNGNESISMTCNHEIYYRGNWVPAGEFARRIIYQDKWIRGEVLGVKQGASPDLWTKRASLHEVFSEPTGIPPSVAVARKQEVGIQGSSTCCHVFHPQPGEQAGSEPQGLQQGEQFGGESKLVYSDGECASLERERASHIREIHNSCDANPREGQFDSGEVHSKGGHSKDVGGRVWSQRASDKRCDIGQTLEPSQIKEIRFELYQGFVYDLHVENNHNYCLTENNYIVHNSGKSFLGCSLIFGDACMYPGTMYFIARKTLADLRKHTKNSVDEVMKKWGISKQYYKYNGQDNFYTLWNGSKVYFLECKPQPSDPQYTRFGSMQFTRGMIEESGEVEDEAKEALSATCGRWMNEEYGLKKKLLLTCNPTKGFLYIDFYLPNKEGTLPEFRKFIQALPTDNKAGGQAYIDELYLTLKGSARERLLFGNWEYDDDPTILIDYENILHVFRNFNVPPGRKVITADIARLGGDRIVRIEWEGYRGTVYSSKYQKIDVTIDQLEESRVKMGIGVKDVLVDADGMGAGVEDVGKFHGFQHNRSPLPGKIKKRDRNGKIIVPNFDNRKSQVGFNMAELIQQRKVLLICKNKEDEKLIIKELEQVRLMEPPGMSDKKISLIPKDDMVKVLRRSPDFWSATLLRGAFDLEPVAHKITTITGNEGRNRKIGDRRRWDEEYR